MTRHLVAQASRGRPVGSPWQRLLAPLLLVAVGLAALCLHATHLDHRTGMPGSHEAVPASTSTPHTDNANPAPRAVPVQSSTIGPLHPAIGDEACAMDGCAVPGDLPGAAAMLCLALLPGLALGLWLLRRRPDKVLRRVRRLASGSPPTSTSSPPVAAPTPLRLCVLRT
ncbi:MAG TPA: hypothetical protein VFJ12_10745 [Segeticoccus sp.]|nr:hypothetical protein [Segeticoccus sp.]